MELCVFRQNPFCLFVKDRAMHLQGYIHSLLREGLAVVFSEVEHPCSFINQYRRELKKTLQFFLIFFDFFWGAQPCRVGLSVVPFARLTPFLRNATFVPPLLSLAQKHQTLNRSISEPIFLMLFPTWLEIVESSAPVLLILSAPICISSMLSFIVSVATCSF